MITVVAFAAAAAMGALVRAEAGHRCNQPEGFPYGTLLVNVVGSFLLGLVWDVSAPFVTILGTAGLGAFTTFSGFARDTVALVERRRLGLVAVYVAMSVGAGIGAAAVGVALA